MGSNFASNLKIAIAIPIYNEKKNILLQQINKKIENLNKCKNCGKDFEKGVKDFCSKECMQLYFIGKIHDAVANDDSHTQNLINSETCV